MNKIYLGHLPWKPGEWYLPSMENLPSLTDHLIISNNQQQVFFAIMQSFIMLRLALKP